LGACELEALRFELLNNMLQGAVVALLLPLVVIARHRLRLILDALQHGVEVVALGPVVVLGIHITPHRAAGMKQEASVVVLPQITKHDPTSDPVGEEHARSARSIPKERGVVDGDEVRKVEEKHSWGRRKKERTLVG
jgi:hypothetical protein